MLNLNRRDLFLFAVLNGMSSNKYFSTTTEEQLAVLALNQANKMMELLEQVDPCAHTCRTELFDGGGVSRGIFCDRCHMHIGDEA